jgi:hypothetical protein
VISQVAFGKYLDHSADGEDHSFDQLISGAKMVEVDIQAILVGILLPLEVHQVV